MGFPIYSLQDYIKVHKDIDDSRFPLKAFFLFDHKHSSFSQYVRDNFEELDQNSERLLFFLVTNPPQSWFHAGPKRDYWKNYSAQTDSKNYGWTEKNVDFISSFFNISKNDLPAIILYTDLAHKNFIEITGISFTTQSHYNELFNEIFISANIAIRNLQTPNQRKNGHLYILSRFAEYFSYRAAKNNALPFGSTKILRKKRQTPLSECFEKISHLHHMIEMGPPGPERHLRADLEHISNKVKNRRRAFFENIEKASCTGEPLYSYQEVGGSSLFRVGNGMNGAYPALEVLLHHEP